MLARRSAVCAGECPRGVPHEVLPQRHGCLAMPIAAAQASSRHNPAHGKHNQVDHMGPMGSKFRCPTEIPDASVVRHDVGARFTERDQHAILAPRSWGVAGDFARRVRREHHNGGLGGYARSGSRLATVGQRGCRRRRVVELRLSHRLRAISRRRCICRVNRGTTGTSWTVARTEQIAVRIYQGRS
jgi:hypothetical protein